jgi:hypothetical protein
VRLRLAVQQTWTCQLLWVQQLCARGKGFQKQERRCRLHNHSKPLKPGYQPSSSRRVWVTRQHQLSSAQWHLPACPSNSTTHVYGSPCRVATSTHPKTPLSTQNIPSSREQITLPFPGTHDMTSTRPHPIVKSTHTQCQSVSRNTALHPEQTSQQSQQHTSS